MKLASKGQAVNIDWTVGLAVFLTSIVGGVLIMANNGVSTVGVSEAGQKASLVQQELRDETFREGQRAPLVVRSPVNLSTSIPVDSSYIFREDAYPGSGAMDVPSEINISGNHVITTVELENTSFDNSSHHISYFFSNTSNLSYSNDLDTGSWINNSEIQVKPGSPGLESLRVDDREVLNTTADLNGNSFATSEEELHASTLDGDLKVYNGSRELIIEDPGTVTFDLENLSTLYWHRDNSTQDLVGTGEFESGQTQGFTVASDYGVTFLGDLDATVSKPDPSTVNAEIDADRLRIFLHNSDYITGRKRSLIFDQGDIFFGTEKSISGASKDRIDEIDNLTEREFEDRIDTGEFSYNITFGSMERGDRIPLEEVVVSDSPSVMLGRYGNYSRIESRVSIWR